MVSSLEDLSSLPDKELKMKINTVVILLRNIDIKAVHCNGTRYLVNKKLDSIDWCYKSLIQERMTRTRY